MANEPDACPPERILPETRQPDWEAFYRDYRKPGYVPGFEITTKLGGGMFGLVFRARKQSIGKDYAIKFLQVDDGEVRRAVLAELEQVKFFAQIDHPNLVSIEDRGEVDGIPYLVMSFAGTETLRDKIATDGRVPSAAERDELLRFFLQACRGVAALHERSLVHFDIKPANVFIKGAVARVGDYGLSKLVTHSRGSLSMGRGTPYYMAPEMLQRRGDARSDVYSLGVVLYELLCGKVPFTGDSEWEVLRQHETAAPALPEHLSRLECAVLQRCLQKDPAARFQSVHDVIAAFGAPALGAPASTVRIAAAAVPPPLPNELPPYVQPLAAPLSPPPLPDRAGRASAAALWPTTPPHAARSPLPRRSSGLAGGIVALLVAVLVLVCFLVVFTAMARDVTHAGGANEAMPVLPPQVATTRGGSANSTAAQVEQMIAQAQRVARELAQRHSLLALQRLDEARVHVPYDIEAMRAQVAQVADAPAFVTGRALRLERSGRGAFLAAVARLQELDYVDGDDCRRAANLHQLLAQLTAIDGLTVQAIGGDPSEGDSCRFAALADGWRRLAETFAVDDATYEELLVAKGKLERGVLR